MREFTTENKKGNQQTKIVFGERFRAGNMHFLISALNFWGEIVLNNLTSEQAAHPYPKYNTRSINVFWGSQILTNSARCAIQTSNEDLTLVVRIDSCVMRTPAILLLLPDICLPLAVDHWGCIYIYICIYIQYFSI